MEMRDTFEVRVPPDVAFAFFADPKHAFERIGPRFHLTWSGPIQPGATFHLDAPKPADDCDGVVNLYRPPHQMSYRIWVSNAPDRWGVITIEFEPTAHGTDVAAVLETHMTRLLELAARALRPWIAYQAKRGTKTLVRALEADYQATRPTT